MNRQEATADRKPVHQQAVMESHSPTDTTRQWNVPRIWMVSGSVEHSINLRFCSRNDFKNHTLPANVRIYQLVIQFLHLWKLTPYYRSSSPSLDPISQLQTSKFCTDPDYHALLCIMLLSVRLGCLIIASYVVC